VNIAARLQALAQPGGACVSGETHVQVRKVLSAKFDDLGAKQVKNIDEREAYAVSVDERPIALSTIEATKSLPLPDKPSIAVLPFQNMSGDPEQEYFADGMVEDIITALSRVRTFFVIARNSSFTYKGRIVDTKMTGSNSAYDMFWKAAFGELDHESALLDNWWTRKPVRRCGRKDLMKS
jgi:adenylate cyclase